MTTHQTNEEVIFNTARKIDSAEAREEYLVQVCSGDLDLRNRVEALLQSQAAESQFLESPVLEPTCAPATIREQPGAQVGRYKLLQKIGEGGFGVVYMAEQAKPVRRKVALKIIKAGMDTKEVIARFEAERQALALMEHPNIARVLDGGSTESGRPYFVMELVKGVPLTQFCDENQLETVERLRLFQVVCKAIQHAHHKGIIHRDIKPSNVMVTLHDGEPIVKVIDFGVSKAISQQLTEKTMFTAYGQMIGTPQYMSPEQAEMSGLDIDTRSDIYSLGVLLYELLTGSTPIKPERLRQTGYAEMQRMIREEEPQRPSVRFSTLGEQSTTVASKRNSDVKKLGKLLRGELDWIVMKALEKNRDRRYETANAMADDVNRFLIGESIAACPPSMTYRFQKFARRNRVALTAFAAIFAILLVASIVSGVLAIRAIAAEERARTNLENFLAEQEKATEANAKFVAARGSEAIQSALGQLLSGNYEEAENLIELAEQYGANAGELAICRGILATETGKEETAKKYFEEAVQRLPDSMTAKLLLSRSALLLGNYGLRIQLSAQLKEMNPVSATDRLFAAQMIANEAPEQAIEWLEQVKSAHNSPTLYHHLGRTYFQIAYQTYELADVERMLEFIDVAYVTMPDNEFAPRRYVQAHILAADAYRVSGNLSVSDYHLQKAEQAAEQMISKNPNSSRPHQAMLEVHAFKDEWDLARKHAMLANKYLTNTDESPPVWELWYRDGLANAQIFEEILAKSPNHMMWKPWYIHESQGVEAALSHFDEHFEVWKESGHLSSFVFELMCLLGMPEQAFLRAQACLKERSDHTPTGDRFAPGDFFMKRQTEEQLVASAKTRRERVHAYFIIGCLRFGEGKRQAATEAFENIVGNRKVLWCLIYTNQMEADAAVFLHRLKTDPEWPAWIPKANTE